MPESVEVAAYYVVAEALTNAAKHSRASEVSIWATAEDDQLRLWISDDGIGGAVAGRGSGLIGLKDRIQALAGRLDICSPTCERDHVGSRHPARHRIHRARSAARPTHTVDAGVKAEQS